jgi:ATP-binding cassette subfamily F protein uup
LLADYAGTVLVVSHDRDFLDRVCTSVIVAEGDGRWQEYAGGYTDMVAQRGRGVEAKAAPPRGDGAERAPRETAPKAAAPTAPARMKLSFRQQHALATLPGVMQKLETEIAQLQAALAAPDLYQRDRARFERFTAALEAKQAELVKAEEEWLELELLREEAEG